MIFSKRKQSQRYLPSNSNYKRWNQYRVVYSASLAICARDRVEDLTVDSFVDNLKLPSSSFYTKLNKSIEIVCGTFKIVLPRFRWAGRTRSLHKASCAVRSLIMIAWWRWWANWRRRCWPWTCDHINKFVWSSMEKMSRNTAIFTHLCIFGAYCNGSDAVNVLLSQSQQNWPPCRVDLVN